MTSGGERGLVLVRLGANHRISGWWGISKEQRGWDLALSLYEDVELGEDACVDFLHRYPGGKWNGIHAFFAEYRDLLAAYDYFWLVDDDIEITPVQLDSLFVYMRTHRFELAQPALTLDSYYSHRLTLCCPGFIHRHTNFVEIMAPVLSREVLERVMPMFANTCGGLGIDWFWHRLVNHPESGVAIIDAISVRHGRPLRQHLRKRMLLDGVCLDEERTRMVNDWQIVRTQSVAFSGKLTSGEVVKSRLEMSIRMVRAYWVARHLMTPRWTRSRFVEFFLTQWRAKIN